MSKVPSFRNVVLTTDHKQLKGVSMYWSVQFVGAPGISFWVSMAERKELTNVHYVCPYRKFDWGWGVCGHECRFIVKEFDFENGIAKVDWFGEILDFYVTEIE